MLPGWTGMLPKDRAAFHFVYWPPLWDLFYTSDSDARELNHDAGNSIRCPTRGVELLLK